MSRSGSAKLSGRRSTALTRVKIAVLAPIPSPSVTTATAAKPGVRRSILNAYLESCVSSAKYSVRTMDLSARRVREDPPCEGSRSPKPGALSLKP